MDAAVDASDAFTTGFTFSDLKLPFGSTPAVIARCKRKTYSRPQSASFGPRFALRLGSVW
jgi:hypothetical protein